jgi:hypothetical protein
MWEDNIEMDIMELYQECFYYSGFGRALNDILMNSVMSRNLHTTLGNILIS